MFNKPLNYKEICNKQYFELLLHYHPKSPYHMRHNVRITVQEAAKMRKNSFVKMQLADVNDGRPVLVKSVIWDKEIERKFFYKLYLQEKEYSDKLSEHLNKIRKELENV